MLNIPTQFAEVSSSESGIGAFNINLKSFIFQLVTFVIVLLVFKRWVLPPLIKTLEDRRQTLEKSLTQAKETEEALARAEKWMSEDGCDCGTDEPGTCALCLARAALTGDKP